MIQYLQYLLEVSACLALFYGLNHFALQKDSFHSLVRSYILFSIVASLTIPIIPNNIIPKFPTTLNSGLPLHHEKENHTKLTNNVNSTKNTQFSISKHQSIETKFVQSDSKGLTSSLFSILLFIIYFSGVLIFLARFSSNIYKIFLIVHLNKVVKYDNFKIIYLKSDFSSFSFLSYIFLQESYFSTPDEQQVIAHEKIHIQQKHTIDILFIELVKIVLWFNPFIWLFKSSLVKVHEFFTDDQLLNQTGSPEKYKELLLKQYLGNYSLELVHPFNSSLLKTRMTMMNKAKSGKAARFKLMLAIPIVAIGLFAFAKTSPLISGTDLNKKEKIEKLLNYYISTNQFNGNILVYQKDNLLYQQSYGYADLKSKEKLNINTPFLLGSVTECFTAASIIILKEQGKLKYSDTLPQFFNDLPKFMGSITIQELLNHTSGIPPTDDFKPVESGVTNNKDIYEIIRKMDQIYFKPGTEFSYSSSGYVLLALIIEKISNQTYQQFVQSNILSPTKMNDTYFLDEYNFLKKNRAIGYKTNEVLFDYPQFTLGNSGIVSTVHDLHKFETSLYSGKIISNDELKKALTKTKLENGEEINFGLGFELYGKKEDNIAGHYSWYGGTKSILWSEIDKKNCIIALTNNSWPRFWEMVGKISRILNDKPIMQPVNKVSKMIIPEDIKPLLGNYRKEGDKYDIKIRIDKNKPYAFSELSSDTFQLYAFAPDTFFINEYEVLFIFHKNKSNSISGFTIHGDEDTKYVKVE